jgi:6-pyruvoyltetrahydropterin/6-carboxytetrahydropterin synthase
MISCTRKIEFDAAHRVVGHENKCKYLHGHRYIIEVTACANDLDNIGRVIDFGVLKKLLGDWIDTNWDHTTILNITDRNLGDEIAKITEQNIYYLPYNPTAENMAGYLLNEICPKLFKESLIIIRKIKLYETPNCFAVAKISPNLQ